MLFVSQLVSQAVLFPIDGPKHSPDLSDGDAWYAHSVDLDDDTAVFGAPEASVGYAGAGAAYVHQRNWDGSDSWGRAGKLTASDPFTGDAFGTDVAISGDFIAVGAPGEDSAASGGGAVYVFHRNQNGNDQWGQVAKLTIPGMGTDAHLGAQVDISGSVLVAGAPDDDLDRLNGGAAYLFIQNGAVTNWNFLKSIFPDDLSSSDHFSAGLSLSGDTLILGSPLDGTSNTGSAYVFLRNHGGGDNWGEFRKLAASDPSSQAKFGTSVFTDGSRVIIGAPDDDEGGNEAGAAYVFDANEGGGGNWGQVRKLTADDAASNDHFGTGVGLSGDAAVVGAPHDNAPGVNSGSAYFFDANFTGPGQWGLVTKFMAFDGTPNDQFGKSAVIQGSGIIVAAPFSDGNEGGAYLFSFGNNLPPNMVEQSFHVPENSPALTVVGDVHAVELDAGQTLAYAITGGSGKNAFAIGSASGTLSVSNPDSLDFEATNQLEVVVQATDDSVFPLSSTAAITIAITDVNETSDLAMLKSAPGLVSVGMEITYKLTVSNHGPDTAFNVLVTDEVPPGLIPAGIQQFNLGSIPSGSSKTVQFEATPGISAMGFITNLAHVTSSNESDPNLLNNTSTVVSAVARLGDVSLAKLAPGQLDASGRIDFTLVVSNAGPFAASNVSLVDDPPHYLDIDEETLPSPCLLFGGTVNCSFGELAAGAATQVTFSATVAPSAPGIVWNTGRIAANNDADTNNNQSTSMTLLLDTDSDGIWNFSDPDDDNDTMPDEWELFHGLNPLNALDAGINNDGDVHNNAEEHAADTNPNDSNSFFRISGISPGMVVKYQSSSNRVYTLERSQDMIATGWGPVAGQALIPGTGGVDSLNAPTNAPFRSHRVRVSFPP